MTSTPVSDAAVQIVWKTLADFLGPDRYRAEQAAAALARDGWLDDPERRAARQVDHDAVVAERDALAERVAELEILARGLIISLDASRRRLVELDPATCERPPVPHE